MKSIPLSRGKFALVDDQDYEWLNKWRWHISIQGYAANTKNSLLMHRVIISTPEGMFTDHINGNKLDNRRSNLRVCSKAENGRNRGKQANNVSGYKGVSWDRVNQKWVAEIEVNMKKIKIGRYEDITDAARAYDEAAKKYFGSFAKTNLE